MSSLASFGHRGRLACVRTFASSRRVSLEVPTDGTNTYDINAAKTKGASNLEYRKQTTTYNNALSGLRKSFAEEHKAISKRERMDKIKAMPKIVRVSRNPETVTNHADAPAQPVVKATPVQDAPRSEPQRILPSVAVLRRARAEETQQQAEKRKAEAQKALVDSAYKAQEALLIKPEDVEAKIRDALSEVASYNQTPTQLLELMSQSSKR